MTSTNHELMANIQINEYSLRSIVVSGDTRSIKKDLMNLGGRWNSKLKSYPGKGWIFPKTKQEEIEAFIGSYISDKVNYKPIISQEEQIKNLEKLLLEKDQVILEKDQVIKKVTSELTYLKGLNKIGFCEKTFGEEYKAICEDYYEPIGEEYYEDICEEDEILTETSSARREHPLIPSDDITIRKVCIPGNISVNDKYEVSHLYTDESLESNLSKKTVKELKDIPEYKKIKGRSKMNKTELVQALSKIINDTHRAIR